MADQKFTKQQVDDLINNPNRVIKKIYKYLQLFFRCK